MCVSSIIHKDHDDDDDDDIFRLEMWKNKIKSKPFVHEIFFFSFVVRLVG